MYRAAPEDVQGLGKHITALALGQADDGMHGRDGATRSATSLPLKGVERPADAIGRTRTLIELP